MSELTHEEKVALVALVTLEMARFTHPFLSQVIGVDEDGQGGQLIGSGIRVSVGDDRFLLTAAHVVEAARVWSAVALSGREGEPPTPISLGDARLVPDADVAAVPLVGDVPRCWAVDGNEDEDEEWALSEDFLFLHGYPADRSYFSPNLAGLSSTTFPFGAMRREDELPRGMEPFQIAIDFDPANLRSTNGSSLDWMDPRGLSGSPLWRVGLARADADTWEPGCARLVGVITQWRPDERLLIASRVLTASAALGLASEGAARLR